MGLCWHIERSGAGPLPAPRSPRLQLVARGNVLGWGRLTQNHSEEHPKCVPRPFSPF